MGQTGYVFTSIHFLLFKALLSVSYFKSIGFFALFQQFTLTTLFISKYEFLFYCYELILENN